MTFRRIAAGCALFLALVVTAVVTLPAPRAPVAVHAAAGLAALGAAMAGAWTWRRMHGPDRLWRLLLGLAAAGAAPGIIMIVGATARGTPSGPPPPWQYLPVYALALASLLTSPTDPLDYGEGKAPGRRREDYRWLLITVLDSVIIVGSFAVAAWSTVLGPALSAGAPGVDSLALVLAVNLVVAVAVVFLGTFRQPRHGPGLVFLGAGLLALAISTYVNLSIQASGSGPAAAPFLIGFPVGWTLIFLALLAPPKERARPDRRSARSRVLWAHAVLPYLPLAAVGALFVAQALAGDELDPVEVNGLIALLVAALARQMATLAENTRLLTRLGQSQRELRHLAFHDQLTGLANRALFIDSADQALARQARDHHRLALLFCDVDDFKGVNDSLGHAAGDELLRNIALQLRSGARSSDIVARLGGDEFAVLLDGGHEDPFMVAKRIAASVQTPYPLGGQPYTARASFGLVVADPSTGTDTADSLLRRADLAMYQAKRQAKGAVVAFHPDLSAIDPAARPGVEPGKDLRRRLRRGEHFGGSRPAR